MRQRGLGRAFAALLLLWFAVVTGAPSAFHSCPVHDRAHATGPDAQHGTHSHRLPDSGDHGACTCIGDCAVGGVAPGVPAARTNVVVAATSQVRAPLPAPDSPAVTAPAFVLPYANGPPGARRVA
jgi:hypothetical protein